MESNSPRNLDLSASFYVFLKRFGNSRFFGAMPADNPSLLY